MVQELTTKYEVQAEFEATLIRLKNELNIKIYSKSRSNPVFWKIINYLLLVLSFGKLHGFLTNYTTTLGRSIYFPAGWDISKATLYDIVILEHEAMHVRQYIKWSLGLPGLGLLIYGFLYLCVPLPIGFAWFRYKFERSAYLTSYHTLKRLNINTSTDRYVDLLTGPQYLWTWLFKKQVKKWFDKNTHTK